VSTTVVSLSETYVPTFSRYGDNDRLYIGFEDQEGYFWSDLTVNLPGLDLGEREVVIDANSADPALIEACESAGLFTYTGRSVPSGFLRYRVAELSESFYNLAVQEADK